MKKIIALTLISLSLSACSFSRVDPGYVGIKVYLTGGNKGVDHEVVGVGWQFLGVNTALYTFPTFKQNYVWTHSPHEGKGQDESITFQTKEGLTVNADIGITYEVLPDKVATLFQKYRKGIDDITDTYLRNYVRDAINEEASKMDVESVYGKGKTALMDNVQARVAARVGSEGINIEKVYLIGQFRLPDSVMSALNAKITATQQSQQRENEVATAKAQADIDIAKARGEATALLTRAKAEAESNKMRSQTISEQLIRLEMAKRWDGALPQFTGGAIPMIDAKTFMGSGK